MFNGFSLTISIPEFSNPFAAFAWIFINGGYWAIIVAVGFGLWWLYLKIIQTKYMNRQKYVLLAVDVPRENEQTPKAVEHMFSHFHGIQKTPTRKDLYLDGYIQSDITVEMVSIDGYIQYLIRCPVEHRDLVESAIYAQYPPAEVSEVEDYTTDFAAKFPNDKFDIWAAELQLTNNEVYPIKTYPLWEHSLTQTFLDPMASLLETMGRLRGGEQIWIQWICRPIMEDGWRKKGLKLINKLIGTKDKSSKGFLDNLIGIPGNIVLGTYQTVTRSLYEEPWGSDSYSSKKENGLPSLMQHLPPNVKAEVEAIGMKISKLGFQVKARVLYLGRKDVFDKSRVSAIMGALKQYASLDMNGFKPDKKMKTARTYFFVEKRVAELKRKIMLGYKYRSHWSGRTKFMLNIEELASVWHFPVITVKAPLVKKTEAKRGEPPVSLPLGEMPTPPSTAPPLTAPSLAPRGTPPPNIPLG